MRLLPKLLPAAPLLALALGLASRADAQIGSGDVITPMSDVGASLVLGAGPTFPVGRLRDAGKNGFAGLLAVGVPVPVVPIGVRLEGMYQGFGLKGSGANLSTLSAGVNAVLGVRSAAPVVGLFVRPFVTGGVGYARTRVGLGGTTSPDFGRGNGVTWNVGGGLGVPIPFLDLGVEARYVETRASGTSIGSVPVFVTLTFRR